MESYIKLENLFGVKLDPIKGPTSAFHKRTNAVYFVCDRAFRG